VKRKYFYGETSGAVRTWRMGYIFRL